MFGGRRPNKNTCKDCKINLLHAKYAAPTMGAVVPIIINSSVKSARVKVKVSQRLCIGLTAPPTGGAPEILWVSTNARILFLSYLGTLSGSVDNVN